MKTTTQTEETQSHDSKYNIGFRQARDLLTDKKIEILEALNQDEFDSIRELVEYVERDKKNVSEDLQELALHRIIEINRNGKAKKPELKHNDIKIRDLDLSAEENTKLSGRTDLG
jgi:predicted transcriptional regulator